VEARDEFHDGFAVIIAIFAIIILGALATAMSFAVAEETKASRSSLRGSLALSSAEGGAVEFTTTMDWRTGMLLRSGQSLHTSSGQAEILVVRLDTTCFFVQSIYADSTGAERRVGLTIEVGADSAGVLKASSVPNRAWVELF
jgi:hypothetical protein